MTFFIFSSSTILTNVINIETSVEAKSTSSSMHRYHAEKSSDIQVKESTTTNGEFLLKKTTNPIYLTFDDGPTEYTKAILKILDSYQVQSTFFMLGTNVVKQPEIVKAVSDSGHTVGCHGVTHQLSAFYKNATSPREEMEACSRAVQDITGKAVQIVRVPFGSVPHLSKEQKAELESGQFIVWDWNVDSKDWSVDSANEMVKVVLNQVHRLKEKEITPVLLFHDKALTVDSLPAIIENLQGSGYEFLPITLEEEPLQFNLRK